MSYIKVDNWCIFFNCSLCHVWLGR